MNQILSDKNLIIRPATNEDTRLVKLLVYSVLDEYDLKPDPSNADADLNDIEENYFKRGGLFVVIENKEGHLVGAAGIYPIDLHICELRKMYFMSQLRGKGLGREVLEIMINEAKQLGFTRMILETASVLKEAVTLYERFGFRPFQAKYLVERCDRAYELDLY